MFADLIADAGGAFVIFEADGVGEITFELFDLGEGATDTDLAEPLAEGGQFGADFEHFGALVLGIEAFEFCDAILDDGDGFFVLLFLEGGGPAGAGAEEEELGDELEEGPGHFLGGGMLGDELEDFEVTFAVPFDSEEVFELEEADVAVVILDAFQLEPTAFLEGEGVAGVTALAGAMFGEAGLDDVEPGFMAHGTFAIGTALGIHLEHPKVDAELDLLMAVAPLEPTC
jgi:hypothetical protein